MKTAIVTTTINVPEVLLIYDEYAPEGVSFFIAGDLKTPRAAKVLYGSDRMIYLSPDDQKHWRSSEIIGWNTDSRRNFAVLEALKWGAELIISVDDDMIPYPTFFTCFERIFEKRWSGLQLGTSGEWFDHGQYTIPPAPARGLPRDRDYRNEVTSVCGVTIGAAQGTILGVPDTDAYTALNEGSTITGVSEILRYGFVTHPQCHSVFNSQITAFRRELAPLFVQFYAEQGRNTDIFASVAMRTAMRDMGWFTHYGLPLGYHNRSVRDLSKDVAAEEWGVKHIDNFAKCGGGNSARYKEMFDNWLLDCSEAMT